MPIITVIIIAISLSLDAFSLSLAYGTLNLEKRKINLLSLIVGIYHFIMPLIGMIVGKQIIKLIKINPDTIVFVVLTFIGLQMIVETLKESEKINILKFGEMLLFGLAVSIDSFSVGLGLKTIYENVFISSIIFSLISFVFTYIGLHLGKRINMLVGKISTLIGGITLIIIGIMFLI